MIKHLTIFVLSGLLSASSLLAQTLSETRVCQEHSCHNNPTPVSVMTSHVHHKNEVMLSYRFMNMDMKGIYAGTQAVDKNEVFNNYLAAPDKMRMHMIMAMYGVTNRLTVMAMLNYNTNSMAMSLFTKSGHVHAGATGDTSGVHHMNTSGVSDIKLNVLYNVLNVSNQQLIVSVGMSLPIGNIKTKGAADDAMYPNRNYAYSMQLGSGTYDFLPCLSYWVQKNKATFSAQLSSVIRMNTNALGYKLGNEYGFVVPTGTFMFHLHTYISNSEVDLYGIDYKTLDGRTISLNMAQLYVSDVQLVKLDGSLVNISGKKILKVFEKETDIVGDAPVGNYKSIRFKIGIDATTNALAPTTPSDSAILNKPAMWFSNAAQPDGYVFMNVQEKVDTSAAKNKATVPFAYKIGTNANYKQVTMGDKNFSVEEGKAAFGHLIIDYSKLFDGIDLTKIGNLSVTTASANSTAIAAKIANNMPSMFIYEQ